MNNTRWYKDAIIYQIYPRSFKDSDNDGFGDIKGIIEKLDYLKNLGINCVWLSPVYRSPNRDNGYDISDYCAIQEMFGTMDDFKLMLSEMHKRGIRLIMDLVMNHTSDQHPWFQSALNDINSPYRDYYIFRKGKGKKAPTNWTGFFGQNSWEYTSKTDSYYLHLFTKEQPDLNWDNPKVREEFVNIIKFWCDMGVDGFRCDVINLISKDQRFLDGKNKIFLVGKKYYINGPHLHEYLHQINKEALSDYDSMTVGETVFSSIDDILKMTGEDREELSMVFNFDHTSVDNFFGVKWFMRRFSLRRWKKILGHYQQGLQNNGWNSLFYENHDQRRSVGRFGTDGSKQYREISAKMLATSVYFLKGTPFIYEGQELGMTNTDITKLEDIQDVETHDIYKTAKKLHMPKGYLKKTIANGTRDNARTPMQWDDSEYAGFSKVKPWLKVNDNKLYINAQIAISDPDSIYHYYQRLIKLRKSEPLVKDGIYIDLKKKDRHIYAYLRKGQGESLLVIANYSKKEVKVKLKELSKPYKILLNNYSNFNPLLFKPYQSVVLKIKE